MGAEIKKGRQLCKYYIENKDTTTGKLGMFLTFCVATGKPRCIYGDPAGYANCPNYQRYSKDPEDLIPKTATVPRLP